MDNDFNYRRNSFRVILLPMFELCRYKKEKLENKDWLEFVRRTKERIIRNPQQFLGSDLPSQLIIEHVIKELFDQYLEEEKAALVS